MTSIGRLEQVMMKSEIQREEFTRQIREENEQMIKNEVIKNRNR